MTAIEKVIETITATIESEGVLPWHKTWTGMSRPISHSTGKGYSILNTFMLGMPEEYITFNQAKAEGGSVKKGAHGRPVCFWSTFTEKKPYKVDENGEEHFRTIPFLKYYTVFAMADIEGVDRKYAPKTFDTKPIEELEAVAQAYLKREGVTLQHNAGNQSYYSPMTDTITLPNRDQFESDVAYYDTLFHEIAHSTGAKNRLDRKIENDFGNEAYSAEELVAEMASAMILAELGYSVPDSVKNNAAYIKHWSKFIKDDPRAFVSACGKAEKAINFILGREVKTETEAA